jgi:single-stranded-DNA-specific exonuclease
MDWKIKDIDAKRRNALMNDGMLDFFATILANRNNGVTTKKEAIAHATCREEDMEDPLLLENMAEAVNIIKHTGGAACIFGDYDVDGVTSTFMARKMFRDLGYTEVRSFIPRREEDGYGLNDKSVRNFIKSAGDKHFDIFLVLDCGSSSRKHIDIIKERWPKCKVVVIDHHIIENDFSSNADAVVNPRIGNSHPFCTGGLMLQLARLLFDREKQKGYYPYGAMATIADVCVLQGTNRTMVKIGLDEIRKTKDIGIKKLFAVANKEIEKCTSEDIGFGIAPMINAAGRMSDANIALMTLEEKDEERAEELAQELYNLNSHRKDVQNEIFDRVNEELENNPVERRSILVHGDWNPGVVGIVAGQLAERYSCPSICFGKGKDGSIKGSARSRTGINIKEVMDSCKEMFVRYGGHEQAAGATLDEDYADEAWNIFDVAVREYMTRHKMESIPVLYDVEISGRMLSKINDKFCERLDAFAPFGNGNERPLIRANGLKCKAIYEWGSGKGGFVKLDKVGIDAYAMVENLKSKMEGKIVDILFTLERSFMKEGKWAMKIQKAQLSEIV